MQLDLFYPPSSSSFPQTKRPCVILVHGGAWVSGSKKAMQKMAREFNQEGFLSVSVEYCTMPLAMVIDPLVVLIGLTMLVIITSFEPPFRDTLLMTSFAVSLVVLVIIMLKRRQARSAPARSVETSIADIHSAIEWIQTNRRSLGINPDQIFIVGHSAGAHLAAMNADHVSGVACLSGVYAPDMIMQTPMGKLLKQNFMQSSSVHMFPMERVHSGLPPHFLAYSEYEWGLQNETLAFASALRSAGVEVEVFKTHGNHFSLKNSGDVVSQVIGFWKQHVLK